MFKGLFLGLRLVAWVKRLALSQEEANKLKVQELALSYPAWGREQGVKPFKRHSSVQLSVASAREINERWRETNPQPYDPDDAA